MIQLKFLLMVGLSLFCLNKNMQAQKTMIKNQTLNMKQQAIVTISAFTAQGNMLKLHDALKTGLDAGLTINEIKEVLVQLYAYCGFPRSLNALNNFMTVLNERKQKGINDAIGKEADALPTDKSKIEFGTNMQTKLIGQPVSGEVYAFAPAIDTFLKEHLFGDIFGRNNLDWKTRELATVSALAAMEGTGNQLRSHFGVGMHNGLTEAQLNQVVTIIKTNVGTKEGNAAKEVLQTVLKQRQSQSVDSSNNTDNASKESEEKINQQTKDNDLLFPTGEQIKNDNFNGGVWLQNLMNSDSLNDIKIGNVTFEAGARTNWHYHPGGQILMVTSGTGYYQEKGGAKKILHKGDVIKCAPNVPHWHGASKNDNFVQVAVTATSKGETVWLQPVTDEEYNSIR